MILGWGLAALLTAAGFFSLGIWAGIGIAEDRAQQADADQLAARPAARPALLPGEPARLTYEALAPVRLPGYADPFPRPGRFLLEAFTECAPEVTVIDMAPVQDAPHGGASRPSTSPDDLDPAVRRLCEETQQYVAALIARTRHTERKYT